MDDEAESNDVQQRTQKRRRSNGEPPKGSGSGRSKPRASLACLNCRQRKTKCVPVADRSTCTTCQSLHVPCVVSRDGDRRKTGSREQVSALQDRLQSLESLVARQSNGNGNAREMSFIGDDNDLGDLLLGRRATESGLSFDEQYAEQATMASAPSSSHDRAETGDQDAADATADAALLSSAPSAVPPAQFISANNGLNLNACESDRQARSVSGDRLHSPAFHALRTDHGRLTPPSEKDVTRLEVDYKRGQMRFYGPTSQLHIHSRELPTGSESANMSSQAGLAVGLNSTTVQSLLLRTFWKSQHLSVGLVDEDAYESGRRNKQRSEYWSPFLENAVLGCATRLSTTETIRALGAKYIERATAQIPQELQDPNIATLQGFLLLSDFEATRGRDRLGYMYAGIGCRMVFDLGLQENCSELIAQGRLSSTVALFRHMLFLGAYIYDKLWSLYLGRPSVIPSSILTVAQRRIVEQGWTIPPTIDAMVGLCTDMSEVTDILNSAAPLDREAMKRLNSLDERIWSRSESLPPELMLREEQLSELAMNAYGLQIQFRGIRIVLHRLLIKAIGPEIGRPERSRKIMHESAVMIARLVSIYQQIFGVENLITIMLDNMFIAAALLISHVQHLEREGIDGTTESDVQWLRCIADLLLNAQKHYPVTARMRWTLASLVDNTTLAGMFGQWSDGNAISQGSSATMNMQCAEAQSEGDLVAFPQSIGDETLLQFPYGDESGQVLQDMDLRNMYSWVLSPLD